MKVLTLLLIQGCNAGSTRQHEPVVTVDEAMFTNGGFDDGTLTGWTVTTRLNPNSAGIPVFPPTKYADLGLQNGGTNYTKVLTTATPLTGIPFGLTGPDTLRYSFRGPSAVVVNENGRNHNANVLRQTATMLAEDVDATDGKIHLRFAAAPVLHNPTHNAEQQPYFFIELINSTTGQQLFNTFNFSNQPGVAWKKAAVQIDAGAGPEDVLYTDWQAFDVAPVGGALNIGDQVQATIVASGCSYNAHFGEVYVDQFGTSFPLPNVNVAAPAYVQAGADLTYNVMVKNGGGTASTNTTVRIDTPTLVDTSDPVKSKATTYVSVNSPGVTCTTPTAGNSGTVTCNIGTLGAGSSYAFTFTIHVPVLAPLNTAPYFVNEGTYNVTSDQTALLTGNLVQTQITGSTPVDIQASLSDGVASLLWGAANTYTLVVKNNGPVAVNGVAITDTRTGFTFTGMTWTCAASTGAACGAASGSNTLSTTANLPLGGSVTYTITATAVNKAGGGTTAGTALYRVTAAPPTGFVQSVAFNNQATDLDYNDASTFTLNLNKDAASTGTGTIVAYPGGFTCGTACTGVTRSFANNTSVAVTAITAPGSAFEGWTLTGGASGTCAGVTSPCVTTVTANGTIAARFDQLGLVPSIAATSNGNSTNVRPGDTVDYSIVLDVPNNFAWPVKVTNTLPTGLDYVSTSTPVATGTLTCAVGSCVAPTLVTGATSTWDFGNVACTTAGGCKITFGIRGRVAATLTRGTTLVDSVSATNLASRDLPTLTIIEPNLTIARTATPNTGVGIGQVSTVTVTLSNGGVANAPVVGAVVTLATPTNLTAGNYQAGTCPTATPAFGANSASFTFPNSSTALAVGASCSFTYDLTVAAGAAGNTAIAVPSGSVTTQSVAGTVPPAKLYTASDSGFSVTTAALANGQPCSTGSNCISNVCDTDNKCGYANGDGPCSSLTGPTVCRSAACSVSLVCEPPGGCIVDGDCSAAQFCNSQTFLCAPKLANATPIPSIAGHTPALTGACSASVGTAVCTSGVCDVADNACGYADGDGTCTGATVAVCRSGVCSVSGVCGVAGGCIVDGDCASTQYCNTPARACVAKLVNGTTIPTVTGHSPAVAGVCTVAAATVVCVSAVCDTDNKCGYADGDGTCTSTTLALCRSGKCAKSGVCGACALDSDCTASEYCNTPTKTCAPKLVNGTAIPAVIGHDPSIAGICTVAAATAVCVSSVCDTDNKCGYADGDGTCSTTELAVCRSGVCSASGVCGVADGCLVDGDCTAAQFCNTPNKTCSPKLANGVAVPTITGHVPSLTSVCTLAAASAVCVSGVCDTADNRCGYADGDGTCNGATLFKCRSGVCSKSGVCGVAGGCLVDEDCSTTQYCDTPTKACAPKLVNGTAIPTVLGHVPALTAICTDIGAAAVCLSGVCDSADNRCGYADGDGTCTSTSALTVCRSGTCSKAGVCGKANGCLVDGDCSPTQYCNTQASTCAPKITNGSNIPTITGHTPVLVGICSDAVATAVCVSASCDPADDQCGLANGDGVCTTDSGATICRSGVCDPADGKCGYADGNGPCDGSSAATVCRSKVCSASGKCSPPVGCLVDADCASVQFCNTESRLCVPKLPNGSAVPAIAGHNPLLTGLCSASVGAAVCTSAVCDPDNRCGYADGSGPCTNQSAVTVCRSGVCAASGVCQTTAGCKVDTDCTSAQFCNTETSVCSPKLTNGDRVPSLAGHDPNLNGVCTESVGAAVCASGICDASDNRCGLLDGKGPCVTDSAAVVCRTGLCTANGVCGTELGCQNDADCLATETCNRSSHQCVEKPATGATLSNVGASLEGGGCACSVTGRETGGFSLTILGGLAAACLLRRRQRA